MRALGFLSYAFIVIAILVVIVIAKTATVVPQQSAYVVEHLGKYSRTLSGRFSYPDAVLRERSPTGTASRKSRSTSPSRSASPATTCRSASMRCCTCRSWIRIWPPTESPTSALPFRSWRKPRCAAKSARSNWTAPSRRAADQHQCGERTGQGLGALGRQGAALRNQEHHPAEGRAVRRWRSKCAPSARSAPSC